MNSKIIFVQRNPKDICVSYYNHHKKIVEYDYDGKFDDYVNRFLKGLGKPVCTPFLQTMSVLKIQKSTGRYDIYALVGYDTVH